MASISDTQLKSGMRCAKVMLLVVNVMFAITAVLLIMIGCTIQALFYDLEQFVDEHFLTPATLLMAIGFILLFVATLGAYGAIKESCLLINLYGVCLLLVFILEVTASIAAFVMKGEVREMLKISMEQSMNDYEGNKLVQSSVDLMQTNLECCGVEGPDEWRKYMNQTGINMQNGIAVPYSCCGSYIINDVYNLRKCEYQYQEGCFGRLYIIIAQSSMLIATGAGTVAFVQFLGAICAFMLAKTLRRHKSLREARRWQLQQNLDVLIADGKISAPMSSPVFGYAQVESEPISYTPNSPSVIN